ncbi:hypothetical protein H6G05_05905 [Pseudanabaena sp. FACHB-1050]|uniref:Uncharacterized protein n=1 Tax=Phormidium tenue FACHB-1050 TaxID=2692857 RepID=A0ABR8CAD6_9CYAN|nr:hypothetical protein [Phormidium tenue FACHB-1050]
MTIISRPARLVTFSVVVRSLNGDSPKQRSKITNYPVSKLNTDKYLSS